MEGVSGVDLEQTKEMVSGKARELRRLLGGDVLGIVDIHVVHKAPYPVKGCGVIR